MSFEQERIKIAGRVIRRASSTMYSLEEFLSGQHGGTDACYSRSRYILLSYAIELLLKSVLVLNSEATSYSEVEDLLRNKGHDLKSIYNGAKDMFSKVGIKQVKRHKNNDFSEYIIKLVSKDEIVVQDFIDVRYDFVEYEKNGEYHYKKRDNNRNEVNILRGYLVKLHNIVRNIDNEIAEMSKTDLIRAHIL